MPKEYNRSDRVADFIKREVASLLQKELRDPRVSHPNALECLVQLEDSCLCATFCCLLAPFCCLSRSLLLSVPLPSAVCANSCFLR